MVVVAVVAVVVGVLFFFLLLFFTIKTSCEGSAAHDDLSRHVPSTLQPGSATFLKAILSIRAPPFLSFWQAHVCIF